MNDTMFLFMPIFFFLIMAFILSGLGNNLTKIIAKEAFLTCAFPDYNTGINNATLQCSHVNHPTSYSLDRFTLWNVSACVFFSCGGSNSGWVYTIPYGGLVFLYDSVTSGVDRLGDLVGIILLVYFPSSSIPNSASVYLFLPYTVFLLMFVYGFFTNVVMRVVGGVRGGG